MQAVERPATAPEQPRRRLRRHAHPEPYRTSIPIPSVDLHGSTDLWSVNLSALKHTPMTSSVSTFTVAERHWARARFDGRRRVGMLKAEAPIWIAPREHAISRWRKDEIDPINALHAPPRASAPARRRAHKIAELQASVAQTRANVAELEEELQRLHAQAAR